MPKESIPRSKSGRTIDYLVNRSNIGKPFRSWKKLMDDPPSLTGPIRDEDIERTFDVGSAVVGGSTGFTRPKGSVGTGARPFEIKGAKSQVKVTQPKPGSKKFIGPVKEAPKNKTKAEAISSKKESEPRYKVKGAEQGYTGPKPKPGSKKFIGPTRATQPGEKGFIGPRQPPKSGDKDFIGPSPRPKSGDSDFIGPVRSSGPKKRGLTDRQKTIATLGGSTAAGVGIGVIYGFSGPKKRGSDAKTIERGKNKSGSYSGYGNRTSSASYGYKKDKSSTQKTFGGARPETPGSYPVAKSKDSGSPQPEQKANKPASDKSRLANKKAEKVVHGSGKMTSFQRAKARQFEREGYGGRSMTAASAKRKAMEKVGGSSLLSRLSSIGRKPEAKKVGKPLTSTFAKKNLAANQKLGKSK